MGRAHHACGEDEALALDEAGGGVKAVGFDKLVPQPRIAIEILRNRLQAVAVAHRIGPARASLIIAV